MAIRTCIQEVGDGVRTAAIQTLHALARPLTGQPLAALIAPFLGVIL
jgi:hypothetical protein